MERPENTNGDADTPLDDVVDGLCGVRVRSLVAPDDVPPPLKLKLNPLEDEEAGWGCLLSFVAVELPVDPNKNGVEAGVAVELVDCPNVNVDVGLDVAPNDEPEVDVLPNNKFVLLLDDDDVKLKELVESETPNPVEPVPPNRVLVLIDSVLTEVMLNGVGVGSAGLTPGVACDVLVKPNLNNPPADVSAGLETVVLRLS